MKSVDHALSLLGYKATPFGLVRIALWAFLFLYLAGLALPPGNRTIPFTENVVGLPITPLVTLPSDPAFIDEQALPTQGGLKIAWISDSSSVIYKPGAKFLDFSAMGDNRLLPVETLNQLREINQNDIHIDLYIRLSLRSLESYTLTEIALERNADIIVLTLNPFFVFNNHAIFKGNTHFARATRTWSKNPAVWYWLALLPQPSDHLWAGLGRHLDIFARAPAFAPDVHAAKLSLWKAIFPQIKGQNTDKLSDPPSGEGLKENSMIFWVTQRYLNGDLSKLVNDKNEAINALWYRQLIRLADFTQDTISRAILLQTLERIKASGKKAILYLAPVSENLREDETAWKQYQKIKSELKALQQVYEDDKVKLIVDIPPDALNGTVFVENDDVHLNEVGGLSSFLASSIASLTSKPEQKESTP